MTIYDHMLREWGWALTFHLVHCYCAGNAQRLREPEVLDFSDKHFEAILAYAGFDDTERE